MCSKSVHDLILMNLNSWFEDGMRFGETWTSSSISWTIGSNIIFCQFVFSIFFLYNFDVQLPELYVYNTINAYIV